MNKPIMRLYFVSLLLFALLIGGTAWWTVVDAKSVDRDHPQENRIGLLRSLKIRRGVIRAADGSLIARSIRSPDGVWHRRYPQGALFGHPVGYSYIDVGTSGLEASDNDFLSGGANEFSSILDELTGKQRSGDDVQSTLDPTATKVAMQELTAAGGDGGSAVALDPRTGAVEVMASVPSYDPSILAKRGAFAALNRDTKHRPLVNRAVQFGYAPGSTMKVVTATAAIDSGEFSPQSTVNGDNNKKISGVPLQNDYNKSWGNIDLTTALTNSVNTVFAQVGEKLGKPLLRKYMRRFGFEKKPELDYPKGTMSASGEYLNGKLLPATSDRVDVGRMAIGQDKLQVTPLQMAQVAAAVANGGKLMKPYLTAKVVDRDGRTVQSASPTVQSTVMQPSTAAAVTKMMESVVQSGTGTKAQIPGVTVAGKTGTAETVTGSNTPNNLWFIAFAPAENPRVAIAVTVQHVPGFGGDIAAPIAKDIMESLLKNGSQ